MTKSRTELFPAEYPPRSWRHRLMSAALFASVASLWGLGLGIVLGWGSCSVTSTSFWHIVLLLTFSTFAGGAIAHLVFGGSRGVLRATLAGGATPLLATLTGALFSGWGQGLPAALSDFHVIGPLFALPATLFGLVYGLASRFFRQKRQRPLP